MRAIIPTLWLDANLEHEGYTTYFYRDRHKNKRGELVPLVTIGVGNLCATLADALKLSMVRPDGTPATAADIERCFNTVNEDRTLDPNNGGVQYQHLAGNDLRITKAEVTRLVTERLSLNDIAMARLLPAWPDWCADGQMGVLSHCWAFGPGWKPEYPNMFAAALRGDFEAMSKECHIKDNEGRSRFEERLFLNAARVVREGLDPERLLYPVKGHEHDQDSTEPVHVNDVTPGPDPIAFANHVSIADLIESRVLNFEG